jgi:dTDP-4-dehydrorhamnose reductase
MKVIVIGATGQLAKSFAEAHAPEEVAVVTVGRPEIELLTPSTIGPVLDRVAPQIVVNAAAYTAVDKAESEPELAYAVNADAPGHLAALCNQNGIPLVHVSTDYVFDGSKGEPYRENDPVAPLGVYGASKLEGERRVAAAAARHIILRTAWVFSPVGRNFVRTMLRLAESRAEISVVDDQSGSPTFAPHLADVILTIAAQILCRKEDADEPDWGIYHSAGTGEATWYDVATEVFEQSARWGGPHAQLRRITTAQYPTPTKRPVDSRLDCTKLEQTFGVRLPNWRVGVAECVKRLEHVSDSAQAG